MTIGAYRLEHVCQPGASMTVGANRLEHVCRLDRNHSWAKPLLKQWGDQC